MPLPTSLTDIDLNPLPVSCKATDYPAGHVISPHSHNKGQLVYAVHGVMVVSAQAGGALASEAPPADGDAPGTLPVPSASGQWIVPPTRGIWIPPGLSHWIRCVGVVHMRSIYVRPDVAARLPAQSQAVGISPLLRELIRAATEIATPYAPASRDGRLMRLLLDELHALPVLPLHLPQPVEPRLRRICARLLAQPDDASTLGDWAQRLAVDAKTLQRLFARETGMTFGQWRQQARLLHGLERLATGDKVVQVALALGYESPSAFATMFKRQFGQTPSEFFR
ncbi:MAG TPA: helix-turn-helix transcriptional regulator [Ideonella sp.]|nr:helix-turn-helix transcriptional regulator [Ideonella sp.]